MAYTRAVTRHLLYLTSLMALSTLACPESTSVSGAGDLADVDMFDSDSDGVDATPLPNAAALERFCGPDFAEVEARIDALIGELSLADKVGLMHGANLLPVDGVWLVEGLPDRGIPGLHMIDGPRGVANVSGLSATAFPVAMARGATWDPALEERVGEAIGIEARAAGADVLLAPAINLVRHPRWGRSQESYGEDPLHVGLMGVAFIRGAQRHVVASVKHLAANSIEDTRFQVDVRLDERTLREVYLPHFRRAVVDGRVGSVMTAYNQVNGSYCAENDHLLSDILLGEWGFVGFVESDWILGTRSTVPSALAGLHIEMPTGQYYGGPLIRAVDDGQVPITIIDDAVRRILRVQLCFDLDSDPPVRDPGALVPTEHLDLAREVGRRGIVLLKNDDDVLPLDPHLAGSLVVTGRLADLENIGDTGSSNVDPPHVVTALQGLTEAYGRDAVTHLDSNELSELGETERQAVTDADVVFVVTGLTADDEGEGFLAAGDRESLELPEGEARLIRAVAALNPRTVVILEGGGAIVMEDWIDDVAAVLMAWYPGLEGGRAIADVVSGGVSPAGRLPVVFPRAESDLPAFDNTSDRVDYGYYHGYRYLDREGTVPAFPFGFGLSYTTFELSNLVLDADTLGPDQQLVARVDVANTGERPAIETIQAYVAAQGSAVDRPLLDLRGFAQVELEPGETRQVTLEIPAADLAYYDVNRAAWVVEAIEYTLYVGTSSRDLPLSAPFMVTERGTN